MHDGCIAIVVALVASVQTTQLSRHIGETKRTNAEQKKPFAADSKSFALSLYCIKHGPIRLS